MPRRNFGSQPNKRSNRFVQPNRSVPERQPENSLALSVESSLARQFARLLSLMILVAGLVCIESCKATGQEVASLSTNSSQSVRDWFKEYDHIRTAAEMSLLEKLQTRMYLQRVCDPEQKSRRESWISWRR
jgi:hypothetical protein